MNGILYRTNETYKYKIDYCNYKNENGRQYYSANCSSCFKNGEEFLMHNEISFNFNVNAITKEIEYTSGWHIGTEDFTFSVEEGDDCEQYIEDYHPGMLAQVKFWVNENIQN